MSRAGRRPTVLLDAMALGEKPTGVGLSAVDLVDALAAVDRGLDFVIVCRRPDLFRGPAERPGWTVRPHRASRYGIPGRIKWLISDLPALARAHGADLVHALTFPASTRLPCPLVMTVHDIAYHHFPQTIQTTRRLWYRSTVPASVRRADRILVNSRNTRRELEARFPEARGKTVVTRFGAPSWMSPAPEPAAPGPGAPFIFVGALEPRKNLLRILEAHEIYGARHPDGRGAPLTIVGAPGWRCRGILDALDRRIAAGQVEWCDYCSRPELAGIYGTAKALVFPSLHEGFGFPILEAMSAGVPVITSDRGAMREIAGGAAVLVDPMSTGDIADAMLKIDADPDFARRKAAAGLARVRDFDWSRTADATTDIYRQLCGL